MLWQMGEGGNNDVLEWATKASGGSDCGDN